MCIISFPKISIKIILLQFEENPNIVATSQWRLSSATLTMAVPGVAELEKWLC
jgi:hypothetical protein